MPWMPDGQWHDAQIAQVVLAETTVAISITIGNTTADAHTYGIDAAWFRVEPCEP